MQQTTEQPTIAPEALNGLGEALWWLGETFASIEYRERAYSGFRARPDPEAAVGIALAVVGLRRRRQDVLAVDGLAVAIRAPVVRTRAGPALLSLLCVRRR
jgi:hypothetical protein